MKPKLVKVTIEFEVKAEKFRNVSQIFKFIADWLKGTDVVSARLVFPEEKGGRQ